MKPDTKDDREDPIRWSATQETATFVIAALVFFSYKVMTSDLIQFFPSCLNKVTL